MIESIRRFFKHEDRIISPVQLNLRPEEYAKLVLTQKIPVREDGYQFIDSSGDITLEGNIDQEEVLNGLKQYAFEIYKKNGGDCSRKANGLTKETRDPRKCLILSLLNPHNKQVKPESIEAISMVYIDHEISRGGVVISAHLKVKTETEEKGFVTPPRF